MSSIDTTTKSGISKSAEKSGLSEASSYENSRPTILNVKFEVEKFDGTNFGT